MNEISLSVRPITSWPWPTKVPRSATFKVSFEKTRQLLLREVLHRGVDDVILEIDVTDRECRRDGWIRADARPSTPRVVVTFEDPDHGWVRYPSCTFNRWLDNMRAVALSLEALRAVNRWGVSAGEQYHGFRSGRSLRGKVLDSTEAAHLIAQMAGLTGKDAKRIVAFPSDARSAIRAALKAAHPDHGGDARNLETVLACRAVLAQLHGEGL